MQLRSGRRGVAGEGGVGSGAVWKEWCSITAQLSHPVVCILWLCSSCMSSLAVALIRVLCTGHMVVYPSLGPPLSLYFFLYLTNLITYKEIFAALKVYLLLISWWQIVNEISNFFYLQNINRVTLNFRIYPSTFSLFPSFTTFVSNGKMFVSLTHLLPYIIVIEV